jgi:hypothetical protein
MTRSYASSVELNGLEIFITGLLSIPAGQRSRGTMLYHGLPRQSFVFGSHSKPEHFAQIAFLT